MLKVSLSHAVPGMTLAVPLHHPLKPGRVLLRAGYELDESAIDRLREIELREIWVRYPSLEFVGEYINPAVTLLQQELAAALNSTFERVADDGGVELEYEQFRDTIDQLVEQFTSQPHAALYIDEICAGGKTHIAHAANVCTLSLLMGLKLQTYVVSQRSRLHPRYASNVVSLGVGAMLHDVGMLQLPDEVAERWAQTCDEDDPEWRAHARLGYEMVRHRIGPSASSVVLNHHQRLDGTGFPARTEADGVARALVGEQIPIFARIVAVADVYDRLRNPPDGSAPRPAVEALSIMRHEPWGSRLDPMVFKALVSIAPPYPPGVVVALSDGRTGVVTTLSAVEPCRPTVRIIADPAEGLPAEPPEGETIDLTERADLSVVLAEGRDVRSFNFYASRDDDFDVNEAQSRLWCSVERAPKRPG